MNNKASDGVRQIQILTDFFSTIGYAGDTLNPQVKATLDSLFGGEGFPVLCDQIFGDYFDTPRSLAEGLCLMDVANISPNGNLGKKLFALLSPTSPFISALEALSTPSPSFVTRLKSGWKDSSLTRSSAAYGIDIPLSSIYSAAHRLLGERPDTDISSLSRTQCSPLLLIPFWEPPLITRKELTQQRVMTSLPCSPIAYFIFRLIFYGLTRARLNGRNFVIKYPTSNLFTWLGKSMQKLLSVFDNKFPVDLPFYHQIVAVYIEHYVSPSLLRHVNGKTSLPEATWTTHDVVATLLIMAPMTLSHKSSLYRKEESTEEGYSDFKELAQVLSVIPFLTLTLTSLHCPNSEPISGFMPASLPPKYNSDNDCEISHDIENLATTLYRNCLIVLRECMASLEMVPHCKSFHFNNCLELWATVLNPWRHCQGSVSQSYVMHRFEAFSHITVVFLNLIVKSSFLSSLDEVGTQVLCSIFEVLSQDSVGQILLAIGSSAGTSSNETVRIIGKLLVLKWIWTDQNSFLPNLHGGPITELAANIYVLFENKILTELNEGSKENLRKCLSFMTVIFPNITNHLSKWRVAMTKSGKEVKAKRVAPVQETFQLTEEERSAFFRGRRTYKRVFIGDLKLPTRSGRVLGGHNSFRETMMRNEMPILIGASRFLDAVAARFLEVYYSNLIPKCTNGHNMWLLHSPSYTCCSHPEVRAIWECSICEVVYGSCCKGFSTLSDGERYVAVDGSITKLRPCCFCGQVALDGGTMFTLEHKTTQHVCPDCASRPYRQFSTRWIAAYRTWAFVLLCILLWTLIRVLSA